MLDEIRTPSPVSSGTPRTADEWLPLIYNELRRLAARRIAKEAPGQTLQATALVHEAYLRLAGHHGDRRWNDRDHFFTAAAEAMRRILIDKVRQRKSLKRGCDFNRAELAELDDSLLVLHAPDEEILAVDDALSRLATEDPEAAEVVKLRYFVGLSIEDAAKSLGISRATAYRHWTYARAWIRCALREEK